MKTDLRRTVLWVEVGVVTAWAILPALFAQIIPKPSYQYSTSHTQAAPVLHEYGLALTQLGQISILLFLIWQSGDKISSFGIVKEKIWVLLPRILGLLIAFILVNAFLRHWTSIPHPSWDSLVHRGTAGSIGYSLAIALAATNEELLFRSYLITRISEISRNKYMALCISAIIFGSSHLYRGGVSFISTGIIALIFGAAFIRWRSLLPLAIAHAMYNLLISL